MVLQSLLRELPDHWNITTRRYPVHFTELFNRLSEDLKENYDYAIHLGQAPGYARVAIEAVGLNIGLEHGDLPEKAFTLVPNGPAAYRSALPLTDWAELLREKRIPASVSYHAGTYLCNAALYLSHYFAEQLSLKTEAAFLHLPLATEQVLGLPKSWPSLPLETTTAAVKIILKQLV